MTSENPSPLSSLLSLFAQITSISHTSLIPKLPFSPDEKQSSELQAYFSRIAHNSEPSQLNTSKRTENLNKILVLLKTLPIQSSPSHEDQNLNTQNYCKELAELIIFLGEQQDDRKEWSSPGNAMLVLNIIGEVRNYFTTKTKQLKSGGGLEKLFEDDFKNAATVRKTVLFHILRILKPKLRSEEWRFHPAAACSFSWILAQINYPYLSDFVDDVLPPILLFTDDYFDSNKLLGINCIAHTVENVNKAELLRNNWGMVIYDALYKLIHEKDPTFIEKLAPTLLQTLGQIEENPNENCSKLTKYDDTVKQILFTMELSSDIKQKKAWMPQLTAFIRTMGHGTLHWADRIMSLLLDYTTCADPQMWLEILKCVEAFIQNTWLKPDSVNVMNVILRIVFNLGVLANVNDEQEANHRQQIDDKIRLCVELISNCEDFEETRSQYQDVLKSSKLHHKFFNELQKFEFSL